jgi:hypothetical protein
MLDGSQKTKQPSADKKSKQTKTAEEEAIAAQQQLSTMREVTATRWGEHWKVTQSNY